MQTKNVAKYLHHTVLHLAVPASVHSTDFQFFTCCQPQGIIHL